MPFWRLSKSERERFVILVLQDGSGRLLDEKRHAGEWTPEDEFVRNRLLEHIQRMAPTRALGPNQRVSYQTDAGKRWYVVTYSPALRVAGVVEGKGAEELQERFQHALQAILSLEYARTKSGDSLTGPIGVENLLDFVARGDAAIRPDLVGPRKFGPL